MSRFTARVELHNASENNYETLHTEMRSFGFSRLITSDDGVTYHLPWAEYNLDSSNSLSQVLEASKKAANATGCTSEILVTESAGRQWQGLRQVK